MAYPTINFKPTTPTMGLQPIGNAESTQAHPLGTIIRAADATYGEGEFVYLAGVASTLAGDVVVYSTAGGTVRAVTGSLFGAAGTGPCAVAMSNCGAGQFGWYQISGIGPVNCQTATANAALYLSSTAGQLMVNGAVTDLVEGITTKFPTGVGNFAYCQIERPTLSGNAGAQSQDVILTGDQTLAGVKTFTGNTTNVNNLVENFATTATAAGTTTLTVASAGVQQFTGSTTQTVVLPDCTTLPQTGFAFTIINLSSGTVTVNNNGGSLVVAIPGGANVQLTCTNKASANGVWVTASTSQVPGGVIKYGTYASRPAASFSGNLYVSSNSPVALWADDGSAWHPLIDGQVVGTQPKAAATYTTSVYSGTGTLTDRNGSLHFTWPCVNPSVTGGAAVGMFYETLSASATLHVEAAMTANDLIEVSFPGNFPSMGVVMLESGTGKFASIALTMYDGAPGSSGLGGPGLVLEAIYWASKSSRTSINTRSPVWRINSPIFLKLVRSSTNILFQWATDAQNWTTIATIALATIFTTAPDSVGCYGAQSNGTTDNVAFDVLHYLSGT